MEHASAAPPFAGRCCNGMSRDKAYGDPVFPHFANPNRIWPQDHKGSFKSRVYMDASNPVMQENTSWDMLSTETDSYPELMVAAGVAELPSMDNLISIMQKCRRSNDPAFAKRVHIHMHSNGLEAHEVLGTYFVSMCVVCGSMPGAEQAFHKLAYRDVYAWTSLLEGYVDSGDHDHVLDLLSMMHKDCVSPDKFAFLALLKASARLKCLGRGQEIHMEVSKQGLEGDSFLGNSLLDMYVKCGSLAEAGQVFDKLPVQDMISWNTLIAGYAEHKLNEEALNCLQQMQLQGVSPNVVTYACSLKACGSMGVVDKGRELHAAIIKEGFEKDAFVSSGLVDMYTRCNSQAEACGVFDGLLIRSVVPWTALIAGYAEHGLADEALNCLQQMQLEGVFPNAVTFVCTLKACCNMKALEKGQELHAAILTEGFERNFFVGSTLVDMYAKCDSLAEAQEVFDDLAIRDVALWNALIAGYAEHEHEHEAVDCLERMQVERVPLNAATFICILKSCVSASVDRIWKLHGDISKYGFESDSFVGSSLVDMYAKAGSIAEAWDVFDKLPDRCVVSWNSLIDGHAELGLGQEALKCFEEMRSEGVSANAVTFLCSLKACGSIGAIDEGLQIHAYIVKLGFEGADFVGNSLVDMYAKCGSLAEAQKEFEELESRDSVSFALLIAGYAEYGLGEQALEFLDQMQEEHIVLDGVTYACSLKACSTIRAIDKGRELHAEIAKKELESDPFVVKNLVAMYAKCGSLAEAQEAFDESLVQDVVLWSLLIDGYADQGLGQEALTCWEQMRSEGVAPDDVTFICILKACGSVGAVDKGQELHSDIIIEGFETDPFIGNTLIDMYAKCGLHVEAQGVFDELHVLDRVSWNAVILSYSEQGESEKAFTLYAQMQERGVSPDNVTFVNILKACGNVAALEAGRKIHAQVRGCEKFEAIEAVMATALIDMYSKCGSMVSAQQVFDTMPTRDLVRWTALITGYARQGESELVLLMFERMRDEGIHPSGITFLSVLTACSHVGLIEKGWKYFEVMSREYNILPTIMHHNCMLGLLGRAGRLKEALVMMEEMPAQPNLVTWSTVLSACQKWGHLELGKEAFNSAASLDKTNDSLFIMMSNIYADSHMWE